MGLSSKCGHSEQKRYKTKSDLACVTWIASNLSIDRSIDEGRALDMITAGRSERGQTALVCYCGGLWSRFHASLVFINTPLQFGECSRPRLSAGANGRDKSALRTTTDR